MTHGPRLAELYANTPTIIHRLDARTKFLVTVGYILTLTLIPTGRWGAFTLMALLWGIAAAAARLDPRVVLTRSLIAAPFLMAALTLLLQPSTPILVQWHLGPWDLRLGAPSVYRFCTVMLRSWLGVLAAILTLSTTPVTDLLAAMEALHIPSTLVTILNMTYRYLFVLVEEAGRLHRARTARSAAARPPYRAPGIGWRARVTGMIIGTLFVRSLFRSERVYYAMLSRGYKGGAWRRPLERWRRTDVLITLLSTFTYVTILWIAWR